jgi:hypothetical protein
MPFRPDRCQSVVYLGCKELARLGRKAMSSCAIAALSFAVCLGCKTVAHSRVQLDTSHLYLTSKRAKLGNSVTVSKNPEHLSVTELHVMCDRMSADPDKYAKLWQANKTRTEFA